MTYEPLHHKYRPQTFADLVGQEAIATTLTNALLTERIAPAYLFTGPRGTGKTSSARILAKSLNCVAGNKPTPSPCGLCEICRAITRGNALDVIEIDAASNTGVDNIREIIERSQFSPVQCRYKVYVIDECHMLSTAAFNALLKTLEEPPDRVIFVLATTDPQRVLPTIISRCQRFDYRRIPLPAMVSHLRKIADIENININNEAITLVSQIANGGLRDAESLLDQLSLLSGIIDPEKVWDLVGAVPEQDLLSLLNAIASNNPETVLDCCRHLMNRGREPLVVLQNLAGFYLNLLIAKTAPNRPDLVAVTAPTWQKLGAIAPSWELGTILQGQQHLKESESQLRNTTQPRLWLEVTLLSLLPSACHAVQPVVQSQVIQTQPRSSIAEVQAFISAPQSSSSTQPITTPSAQSQANQSIPSKSVETQDPTQEKLQAIAANPLDPSASLTDIWQEVLIKLNTLTQSLVRSHGHLMRLDGNAAQVGIKTEPLLRIAHGKIPEIEAAFTQVCGRIIRVKLAVDAGEINSIADKMRSLPSEEKTQNIQVVPIAQPDSSPPITNTTNGHNLVVVADSSLTPPPVSDRQDEPVQISIPSKIVHPKITTAPSQIVENPIALPENYAENDLKKAAESLAKAFDGEVVYLDQSLDLEDSKIDTEQELALPVKLLPPLNEPVKSLIQGRPQLTDAIDEEDMPF